MDEFLNAKSMLAPGLAGATTTLATGALVTNFDFLPSNWTGLTISFLIGLLVLSDQTVPRWQRLVLYFVNSLIIFSVAIGINAAGVAASRDPAPIERKIPDDRPRPFFHEWL